MVQIDPTPTVTTAFETNFDSDDDETDTDEPICYDVDLPEHIYVVTNMPPCADDEDSETDTPQFSVHMAQHHLIERLKRGSLVDRGANGGIIGNDARPFFQHKRSVDVTGIARHELSGLPLCDAAAKLPSNRGPVIEIFQNYSFLWSDGTLQE